MLWHNQTGWDDDLSTKTIVNEDGQVVPDEVATEAVTRFRAWMEDIPRLKELQFPRYIKGELDFVAIFGDASKTGIGVVAYTVTKPVDGVRHSHILYSKSTLMPKNLREKAKVEDALTIARAELIAMVCCVTMSDYIRKALGSILITRNVHIFTDSLLNLQRIQRGKGKCKPWEERRVCKVLDEKEEATVRFCPGVQNPSDLPSRGCTMSELIERLDFWREGPAFLKLPESEWPKQPCPAVKASNEMEKPEEDLFYQKEVGLYFAQLKAINSESINANKAQVLAAQEASPADPFNLAYFLEKISSLQKIRGIIIRAKRYVERLAKLVRKETDIPEPDAPLSAKDVVFADNVLARFAQNQHLSKELSALSNDQRLPKGSVLKDLPVYYDTETKLIRLRSRLHTSSSLSFDFTTPVIMPKSVLAQRLAFEVHQRWHHCSQKTTFNVLREHYWFCGGYKYVKELVRKSCKTPRCRYIQFMSPRMSPLPDIRIDNPEPWRNVGVDYLGPNFCKHDCKAEGGEPTKAKSCLHPKTFKVWQAVFTCLHTRAIHVETVTSCTTQDFLIAFRKFVALKGRPMVFYSDQARTFTAADKQLRTLLTTRMNEIQNFHYGGSCPIEWKFSTETAPWSNGCTERLVGIFKKQLKVLLQKHPLTLKQMDVIIAEVLSSINDRPLGITREGLEGPLITPNLLNYGGQLNRLQTPSAATMQNMPANEMWIERKKILAQFWSKWQSDYLNTLSVDNKWLKDDQTMIKAGDVVILKPETLEKNQWRIARIMDVHKNLNGVPTTASVKLPSGTVLTRTLRQLALLEPSYIALEGPKAVQEESAEPTLPSQEEVRSENGFDGSSPPNPFASAELVGRTRPDSSPCLETGEQSSDRQYPGEVAAAVADPETPAPQPVHPSDDQVDQPRSKRPRKRVGYYKKLAEGHL